MHWTEYFFRTGVSVDKDLLGFLTIGQFFIFRKMFSSAVSQHVAKTLHVDFSCNLSHISISQHFNYNASQSMKTA